jgi:hypothetical protein
MKASWMIAPLLVAASAGWAQTANDYMADAKTRYPQLAVAGSPMSQAFAAAVKKAQDAGDPVMKGVDWPVVIAQEVAAQMPAATAAPAPTPPATAEELVTGPIISAANLASAYKANEAAADASYKNKVFIVTGKMTDFGRDTQNAPFVILNGDIECTFADADNGSIVTKALGTRVAIAGSCDGKTKYIQMSNCKFRVVSHSH